MVLSIWYPVGEGWKILMVAGGYILNAVVAGVPYKSQRNKAAHGRCANRKFAYEGLKKLQNVRIRS